ncbi:MULTISPECIES: hypothetical protein [Virgibacillus]|uniref:Sporulation lipoprotein, YhcN/YlaJ family n=2 Tax=Virgibacillus TaxID=84406 RepID=A0A024QBS0_9BACI|nr:MULTISPECIES: hypothetical protein [Virgibacillus]EQB35958.1 hypothetical protein M948_13060 [Virgibacillus sp. CM-4]MYL41762.1 hypothetical protein [Virgibacillus massiliensis]GGJ47787.1 hypothetical protein GCM10007111_07260 [Virgibacillus kapii]CDQ39650.1 hypothetical protein BN990_01962 [Virgibacillus massiliensis]
MKRKCNRMMLFLFLITAALLTACTDNNDGAIGDTDNTNDMNMANVSDHANNDNVNDPNIIPSETSDKTRTTNKKGTTYSGMGQNLYSSIGSSGIHEGGVSSFFESILESEGITGVKVFVVDDSVVLARDEEATTSHQYDNMQKDVLSGTDGLSSKGETKDVENNTSGNSGDNLEQAKQKMNTLFNGDVKILTATEPGAVDLIESIKSNIMDGAYQKASDQLLELLNKTE